MSENKRNIDKEDLKPAKRSQGNALPAGTGAHARHRREEEEETKDNTAEGQEGRKAGMGKGHTRP